MVAAFWTRVFCVALAGAFGALARWSLSVAMVRYVQIRPLWGTLIVNVLGCFLFGLFFQLMHERVSAESPLRLLVFTGFLAAFTTYSTFAFETHMLYQAGAAQFSRAAGMALLNIVLHVVLGWSALAVGMRLGKALA